MPRTKKLFEPIRIGNVELRNRVMMLSMVTGMADNYKVSERLTKYLAARARGGAGLVFLGSCLVVDCSSITPVYNATKLSHGIWSDDFIPGLRSLTGAIHQHGAKAGCQLAVHYEWRPDSKSPLEGVGPSAGAGAQVIGQVRELSVSEIHQMVEQFGEGARRAREAGFDIVEFLFGMGYIPSRFSSPYSNRRTDEYGGSLEKRMRFLLEIVDCARKKAGSDYTLMCRFSPDEFLKGGNTIEDTKKIVPMLEQAGIAAFNTQPGWHESPRPMVQQWVPAGAFAYLAEEVKRVTRLPVAATYRIDDPLLAEEIVASGKADFVGMARALIADADLPNKAREGRFDEIRYCTVCCRCIEDFVMGLPVACSVNASLDIEPLGPAPEKKKVLIIGGGPAGMEAARVAASRGHKVTLVDKGRRLGGLLVMAAVLNDKLENLVRWMRSQVKGLPIEVRLKTALSPALLEDTKPDVIIVAPGGVPRTLDVSGVDGKNVISSYDIKNLMNGIPPKKGALWGLGSVLVKFVGDKPGVMRKLMGMRFPIKKNVVIIGGQFAGLEVALTLMEKGKKVTVLEESKRLGADVGPVSRWVELDMLRNGGVKLEALVKVKEISEQGVKASREGGGEEFFEADTVILALPLKGDKVIPAGLEGKASVYVIGDAVGGSGVRRIREAITSGFDVASRI